MFWVFLNLDIGWLIGVYLPTLAVFQLYLQLWQYFSFISNFGSISALSPTLAVFQLHLQLWQYFSFISNFGSISALSPTLAVFQLYREQILF
jgi:hypothetical protein